MEQTVTVISRYLPPPEHCEIESRNKNDASKPTPVLAFFGVENVKIKQKKLTCCDQDSNLGFLGHNERY